MLFQIVLAICLMVLSVGMADSVTYQDKNVEIICDTCEPGEIYAFMAVRGTKDDYRINAESLAYAAQIAADTKGKIQISIFGEAKENTIYLLGGSFADGQSPHLIGVRDIKSATWPKGLREIGNDAFSGSVFQVIILEEGVTRIGERAFKDCTRLEYIRIPETVSEIGTDAFAGCNRDHLIISCEKGSKAWEYAEENGITTEEMAVATKLIFLL